MKKSRLFLIVMALSCWSSLLLINRRDFKRYLPAAIFSSIVTKYINVFAKKRRWWTFYQSIHPKVPGEDVWAWGPFFTISIWVLKWTYGKLPLYIMLNSMIHILFAFFVLPQLKRVRIFSLLKINPIQYITVLTVREALLYGFQSIKEYIGSKMLHMRFVNGKSQDR